jgi:hypothetical protein
MLDAQDTTIPLTTRGASFRARSFFADKRRPQSGGEHRPGSRERDLRWVQAGGREWRGVTAGCVAFCSGSVSHKPFVRQSNARHSRFILSSATIEA